MQYEYFYGAQAEQFSFYRIPKALFTEPNFRELSTDAKVLYGILLDRMSLSLKNQWLDAQNKVYIIFTVDEIMDALNCANQKATRLMVELEKQAGLIERKRQGLGRPNLIYPAAIQESQFISLPNDFRLMVPAAFFHFNALRLDFRIELFQSFLNLSRGQISLRTYPFFQPCLDFLKLFAYLL